VLFLYGLVKTISSILEHVEHRVCVKQLYGNWRNIFPEELFKEALSVATRSNTMPEFKKVMDHMKKLSEGAWEGMNDLAPGMWSRKVNITCTCYNLHTTSVRHLIVLLWRIGNNK